MRRQKGLRRLRPQMAELESRLVLSNIGVVLDFNSPESGSPVWVDVHNLFNTWGSVSSPWTDQGQIPVNSDNYPLEPASTFANLNDYPDGDYQLSYQGSGTVSFSGIGSLSGPLVTSNGVTTGTVVVNKTTSPGYNDGLILTVTNVSATSTISNFHLYTPGYGSDPTQMFTNQFLNQLKPFSTIRYENWMQVIGSTISTWQQRTPPTSFLATTSSGVPYEDMIELANESQTNMWINIPALADSNYVQNLAELIKADLDPNLKVYVEYSDETWNWAFPEAYQIMALAQSNPLVTPNGDLGLIEQQTAYEIVQISNTFNSVFGAGNTQVQPVLAGFIPDTTVLSSELGFIESHYGSPSQYIADLAIAPYIGPTASQDVPGLTLDQLFADLDQNLSTYYIPWLQSNEALAQQWGLPLITYEGGQNLTAPNNIDYSVMLQAQSDPRMYQFYTTMMNEWNEYVGPTNLFMAFSFTYEAGYDAFWGLLDSASDIGSQKYDAMLSELLVAGDANMDGTVDFADFQILAADYGMTNAWWEQGDFNDGGVVNWSDLNLLRSNLDPAATTLAQFAQIATFGQPATIPSGQAPEYDGYGVTYVSDMPWISSSNGQGVVESNASSSGSLIVLDGQNYSQGLGVYADSDVVVELAGDYSRFESEIGVDGETGGSVIFDVYGDGNLLYQSPTMTVASGAIPIDLNVSGVQQLSLVVKGATSNTAGDHAVWADARVISTQNFSQYQVTPYTLTWQVSEDGEVLTTDTTDSFVFPYTQPGIYTLTLTVTDSNGDTASSSTAVTVTSQVTSASFLKEDETTGGEWIGTYGSQGYNVIGAAASYPSYAVVTPQGISTTTWAATTTDPQGLEEPGYSGAIAAAWTAASEFSINLDLTDGQAHDLALYAVDWNASGLTEEIQITNTLTGAVLASQTISNFSQGVYLDFLVSGNVTINVIGLNGTSPVLSGLFFDAATAPPAATASFIGEDTTTQGNWIGSYGGQGYNVVDDAYNNPSYAAITIPPGSAHQWVEWTTAPPALEYYPSDGGRMAGYWTSGTSWSMNLDLTDGLAHNVALYLLDWNNKGLVEQVQVTDNFTGTVLSTETVLNFSGGVYLDWRVSGSVTFTFTSLAGGGAVVSGLFFDAPSIPSLAVTGVTPTAGAGSIRTSVTTGLPSVFSSVSATFNEPVLYGTISFVLDGPNSAEVPAVLSYDSATDTATLIPASPLAASTTYTARVSQVENLGSAALASPYTWSFTTAASATAPPLVISQTPNAGGTADSPLDPLITATWNEPVSPGTISFVLEGSNSNVIPASVSYNSATNTATLSLSVALAPSTTYTLFLSGAENAAGTATMSTDSWSFTTPQLTGESLWNITATPLNPSNNDSRSVNLGVKFTSDVAGYITGIRFYKGSGNTGTHIGYLWTSNGTLLASATFTDETATGWQQVDFSTPVAIQAGVTYVASYFAPNGYYAADVHYFATSGVSNGPLDAPSSPAAGGNGVYLYGASGGFPTSSYEGANYWVDVVFQPTTIVASATPAVGATGVSLVTPNITATLNPTLESGTLSCVLTDANSNVIPTSFIYDSSTDELTLTPSSDLTPSMTYTATVSGTFDVGGDAVGASYSWSFTTTAIPCVSIWSASSSPSNPSQNDSNSVNVGVEFSSDVAGYITSIRFYKGSGNTGTHIGYLWTSNGTLLASATFTDETATGWQQVNFSTPVAIAANTTYVASYFAPDGHYAADVNYFANSGVSNGPLDAPASTLANGNGLYLYGSSGAFPTNTYSGTNYWVDVVFSPSTLVVSATPVTGASGVSVVTPDITAILNPTVQSSTLSFVLTDSNSNVIPASLSYSGSTNVATLTPNTALVGSMTYTATISGTFQLGGTQVSGSYSWSFTTTSIANESIWSSSATPANPSNNDPNSINVGVKFTADVAGYITGIRFYKGSGNTGTHIGYLWTSNGTLLASATFTDETATGWQQVNFSTPVAIQAGITYVASYFAPNGYYAADVNYFGSSGVSDGTLDAPSSPAAGGNGVYLYGAAGGFPTNTYEGTNYWVDVVFNAGPVASTTPASGATAVSFLTPNITATISPTVQPGTLSFVVEDASSNVVQASFSYNSSTGVVTLTPNSALAPSMYYTATLSGTFDVGGIAVSGSYSWSFTTTANANFSIWNNASTPANPSNNGSESVNLGVEFSSDVAGYINGIRFYKGSGNTGTHIGYLWTSNGTLLASATFTDETATGWQQVNFSTPVAIAANTTYVASYFAPDGHYAADVNYFANSGVSNGPLDAPASTLANGNGLYLYGSSGAFPTNTYSGTNYWVDVVFNAALFGSTTPAPGASDISVIAPNLTAAFNAPLEAGSLSFTLTDANSNTVPTSWSYDSSTNVATFAPSSFLTASMTYTATLTATFAVGGVAVSGSYTWSFTTTSIANESIWSTSTTPANPAHNGGGSVNVGVRFESSMAGYITGIRFYEGSGNTGTQVGYLWTSTGTLLASATFTDETSSGWQQVNFSTPVAIAADTVYVASYLSPSGIFAWNDNYFTSSVTNGPLTALSSSASGGNGVYTYSGTGAFPTSSYQASNYWVDVVFSAASGQDTTTTPAAVLAAAVPGITATVNPTSQGASPLSVPAQVNSNIVPTSLSDNSSTSDDNSADAAPVDPSISSVNQSAALAASPSPPPLSIAASAPARAGGTIRIARTPVNDNIGPFAPGHRRRRLARRGVATLVDEVIDALAVERVAVRRHDGLEL